MNGKYLFGRDPVPLNYNLAGEVADSDNPVSCFHPVAFYIIHNLVYIFAGTIEFGGMNMDNKRFPANFFCSNTRGIGKPVMSMDHIILEIISD